MRRNLNRKIMNRKEKGECMLECTQFEKEKKTKYNIKSINTSNFILFELFFKSHINDLGLNN